MKLNKMTWWRFQFLFIKPWKKWRNRKKLGYVITGPAEISIEINGVWLPVGRTKYMESIPQMPTISIDSPITLEQARLIFGGDADEHAK